MKKETRKALENIAAEMIAGGMQCQGVTIGEIQENAEKLTNNELLLFILDFIPDNIETRLEVFEEMRNDLETMATYEDNERELLEEIATADTDILTTYKEIFLNI